MNSAESSTSYHKQTKAALITNLIEKDLEIQKLHNILSKLSKQQFGKKSEKLSTVNTELPILPGFVQPVPAPQIEEQKPIEVPAHTRAARKPRDLSELPRNRIICEPESKLCLCCNKELSCIGEDSSQELEHQPAKMFINVYVRPKYACNHCKEAGVLQAELPATAKPLERSIAGAGLLSQVVVSKYVDHIPLHRQEQIFERKGIPLARNLLSDWVAGVTEQYLERLWEVLKAEVLKEPYLQADETTLKVQDGEVQGKCHTGYLWGASAPVRKLLFFEYADSRAGAVPREIFKDFYGTLQTDLYAGYNTVLLPDKVQRIACLAHVRRKFIEAGKSCSKEANVVLSLIAEAYKLDNQYRSLSPQERQAKRQLHVKPIFEKLEKYLRELSEKTLPKAPLMEAISYALKQWVEILRILDDGNFQLDNNIIENKMRPIALGRKNYLFAGSHEGAKRAAIIYSLFGTAKMHNVNPYEWLKDILQRMRNHPVNRIHLLLPHNWKLIPD